MFVHDLETLEELEDYIEDLNDTIGLSSETYKEVKTAISKRRDELPKESDGCDPLSHDSDVIMSGECSECGGTDTIG